MRPATLAKGGLTAGMPFARRTSLGRCALSRGETHSAASECSGAARSCEARDAFARGSGAAEAPSQQANVLNGMRLCRASRKVQGIAATEPLLRDEQLAHAWRTIEAPSQQVKGAVCACAEYGREAQGSGTAEPLFPVMLVCSCPEADRAAVQKMSVAARAHIRSRVYEP